MSNPMAKITRLTEEQRQGMIRPAHRLTSASKLARRYYHGIPLRQDLVEEQNALNAWATVTICYSGIEQAIKFLLKIQGSLPSNYQHHRIGTFFQKLPKEQREVVRESYSIYQSLHNYIEPEIVDDFLSIIGDGYIVWRHFLSDGGKLPTTHCGAMLEIWSALANIIDARVGKNPGLYHCARRFHTYLSRCIYQARQKCADRETGEDIETTKDWNRWQNSHDCLLNSWANWLQQHATGTNELNMRPSTEKILLASVDLAKECAQSDQDFAYFLNRAEKHDITWDHQAQRFKTP